MSASKTSLTDLPTLILLAVGGYVVYKLFGVGSYVAKAAASGYAKAVDTLATGLYVAFGPVDRGGPNTYYVVNFPDGARHAIPSDIITSDGLFTWEGYPPGSIAPITLQLVKDQQGKWYATENA